MKFFPLSLVFSCVYLSALYAQTETVTSPADSGGGSLRQAITNINAGSDASNTINMQVPGNSPRQLPLRKRQPS